MADYIVQWQDKNASATVARPEGTYYRVTCQADGVFEAQTNKDVGSLTPGSEVDVTISYRSIVGTARSGGMSANFFNSTGGYVTNESYGAIPTAPPDFTTLTYRKMIPANAAHLQLLPSWYNGVIGDTIDLAEVVTITAVSTNTAPVVSLSEVDTRYAWGDAVQVTVSWSDPDINDSHSITWSVTAKPGNSTLAINEATAAVSFIPDIPGSYTVRATVADSAGGQGFDERSFTVHAVGYVMLGGVEVPIKLEGFNGV